MTREVKLRLIAVGAVILACSVCYFVGKKQGHLDEKLSQNRTQIAVSDSVTKAVTIVTQAAKAMSDSTYKARVPIRAKLKVVHDTVLVETPYGNEIEAVSPVIAQLITTDDSVIAAQQRTIELQKALVAALQKGIALRIERISLLESRGPQRFSRGLQIGGGYCQNVNGRTPCVYVGYGIQVRIP